MFRFDTFFYITYQKKKYPTERKSFVVRKIFDDPQKGFPFRRKGFKNRFHTHTIFVLSGINSKYQTFIRKSSFFYQEKSGSSEKILAFLTFYFVPESSEKFRKNPEHYLKNIQLFIQKWSVNTVVM